MFAIQQPRNIRTFCVEVDTVFLPKLKLTFCFLIVKATLELAGHDKSVSK